MRTGGISNTTLELVGTTRDNVDYGTIAATAVGNCTGPLDDFNSRNCGEWNGDIRIEVCCLRTLNWHTINQDLGLLEVATSNTYVGLYPRGASPADRNAVDGSQQLFQIGGW